MMASLALTAARRQDCPTVKDVVEARKSVLKDVSGKDVAVLSVVEAGGAFRLSGVGGKRDAFVELFINEFTSGLRIVDRDSQFGITQAGGPT
jgi:hypothetical protein